VVSETYSLAQGLLKIIIINQEERKDAFKIVVGLSVKIALQIKANQ
jgi:hypothetical protein